MLSLLVAWVGRYTCMCVVTCNNHIKYRLGGQQSHERIYYTQSVL